MAEMDEIFKKLKKDGKNQVDTLVKWIKDAKLVDNSKVAEDKVRALFADVKNSKDVDLEKFQQVVGKLAVEQKKSVQTISKKLAEEGPRFIEAIKAGVSAFKKTLSKKK